MSQVELANVKSIISLYGNKFRFSKMYESGQLVGMFDYIRDNFKFSNGLGLGLNYDEFALLGKGKCPDSDFYLYLRKVYDANTDDIILSQINYRKQQLDKKINSVVNVVNVNCIERDYNVVLDVGTEDINFLDKLGEKLLNAKVIGLNVGMGYECYKQFDPTTIRQRIILYDGVNFLFDDNQFDLVTLITVVHHVEHWEKFLDNLCKITKALYIVDNNIMDDVAQYHLEIQHELYEGILYFNDTTPLFPSANNNVVEILERNNFSIVSNSIEEGSAKSYILFGIKNKNCGKE